jgi:hypothetical protein
VLLTVKLLNLNVKLSVKNQDVTGNVINQLVLNLNANLFVKIQTVFLKLNVAHVPKELPEFLNHSPSSKKLNQTKNVVLAKNKQAIRSLLDIKTIVII